MSLNFGGNKQKSSQNSVQSFAPSPEFLNLVQPGLDRSLGLIGNYQRTTADDISGFMNPYLDQVAATTSQQIQRSRDITGNNLDAQAARAGAFGGTGWGLLRGENNRAYADAEAGALASINAGGFNAALQAALGENQAASGYDMNALNSYLGGLGLLSNWGTTTGNTQNRGSNMGFNLGFKYGGG